MKPKDQPPAGEEPDETPTRVDHPVLGLGEDILSEPSMPTLAQAPQLLGGVTADVTPPASEVFTRSRHTEILRVRAELQRSATSVPRALESMGPYALMSEVAPGGDSELRLAQRRDERGRLRWCVIKRVHAAKASPEARALFLDELRVARLLGHPNVVTHYASGELEGWLYLALELIEGWSVAELAHDPNPSLPIAAIVDLGRQLASALAYVHTLVDEQGEPLKLVHRDVTPENVMVSRGGVVKLVDFGISAFRGKSPKTQHGFVRGTERYMAPEQLAGAALDGRTDLYAFGLVLAELVGSPAALEVGISNRRALEHAVRETCRARREAPPELVELLARSVAYAPDRRPTSAHEVHSVFESLAARLGAEAALRAHLEHSFTGSPWALDEIVDGVHDPSEEAASTEVFELDAEITNKVNARPSSK